MQVCAPVEQDVTPLTQRPGLVVHEIPAVHATQVPDPLQTMLVPQDAPAPLGVLLLQTIVPVEQLVMPV